MLITFDGHDGVGKTTIAQGVYHYLKAEGYAVMYHSASQVLPDFYKESDLLKGAHYAIQVYLLSHLYTSLQYELRVVYLKEVSIMLVDRYIFSTLALLYARKEPIPWDILNFLQRPHLSFRIIVPENIRRLRLERRGMLSQRDEDSLSKEIIYRADVFYRRMGLIEVDNSGTVEEAVNKVVEIIEKLLQGK